MKHIHSFLRAAALGASLIAIGLSSTLHAQAKTAAKPVTSKDLKPIPEHMATHTGTLTLETFLNEVRRKNGSFQAAQSTQEGATERQDEWKLITRPNLIGEYSNVQDYREPASPFMGSARRDVIYSVGLQEQFNFGLQATLKYTQDFTEQPGIPATFGLPVYTTAGPSLELKQSLWRNFFGGETEALQEQTSAGAELAKYSSSFQQTMVLTDAEAAYWRLALAREAVAATHETYDRALRLREWSARRRNLELADRSDLLQAESALLARQLELQIALDEEKSAARVFNTFRSLASDEVPENLVEFDAASIDKLTVPPRVKYRDDVKAEEQRKRLAEAQAKAGLERNKPTVDLVGAVGFTGRDPATTPAVEEGWTTKNPNYMVGLRLNVPLDLGTSSAARSGYRKEAVAADVAYRQKVFEQDRLWEDVLQRFQDSVARFKLATRMEASQREKLDYERVRQSHGRTTTYQVILFEQDFANAALSRIRAQADVLNAYAQLKTFSRGVQ